MINNDITINVEIKNKRVSKMTKLHSLQLEFTLQYITLTNYYNYFRGHIHMINNDNIINGETKTIE